MGKHKDILFRAGLGLAVLNFLFDLVAFVSPAWLESIPEFKSTFVRIGLWVACFDNFVFPEDYVSKTYKGCWYVYYPEYDYIRYWFNPAWFYGVQMLSLVAFICRCVLLMMVGLMACDAVSKEYNKTPFRVTLVTLAYTTCSSIIVLTIMGVKSKDRDWMPRPDQNRLSWGYGSAVMAGFCSVFGFMIFIIIFLREYWKAKAEKSPRYNNAGIPMDTKPSHPSVGAGGPQYANYPPRTSTGPAAYQAKPDPQYGSASMPAQYPRPSTASQGQAPPMHRPQYSTAPGAPRSYTGTPPQRPYPGAPPQRPYPGAPPQRPYPGTPSSRPPPSASGSVSGQDTTV